MTGRDLIIVGGGEHARVVAEAARSVPGTWRLVGYTAPAASTSTGALADVPWLGDDQAEVTAAGREGDASTRPALVLGFRASPSDRRRITATYDGADWATIVHDRAWVAPSASLGPGVVVLAGAIVNAGASIGAHALINSHAVVEHDVVVGPGTHVAPGAVIGGGTHLGADVTVGLGANPKGRHASFE